MAIEILATIKKELVNKCQPQISSIFIISFVNQLSGHSIAKSFFFSFLYSVQYGIKKKEEKEAEAAAAMEQASEGSLTRPKKAVPTGCGDEEEEESIVDTVMKFIPAPLMDMFSKK